MSTAFELSEVSRLELGSRTLAPDETLGLDHPQPRHRVAASGEPVADADTKAPHIEDDRLSKETLNVADSGIAQENHTSADPNGHLANAANLAVMAPSIVLPELSYPPATTSSTPGVLASEELLTESTNTRRLRMGASFVTLFLAGWK